MALISAAYVLSLVAIDVALVAHYVRRGDVTVGIGSLLIVCGAGAGVCAVGTCVLNYSQWRRYRNLVLESGLSEGELTRLTRQADEKARAEGGALRALGEFGADHRDAISVLNGVIWPVLTLVVAVIALFT